jgi:hypothetical protein
VTDPDPSDNEVANELRENAREKIVENTGLPASRVTDEAVEEQIAKDKELNRRSFADGGSALDTLLDNRAGENGARMGEGESGAGLLLGNGLEINAVKEYARGLRRGGPGGEAGGPTAETIAQADRIDKAIEEEDVAELKKIRDEIRAREQALGPAPKAPEAPATKPTPTPPAKTPAEAANENKVNKETATKPRPDYAGPDAVFVPEEFGDGYYRTQNEDGSVTNENDLSRATFRPDGSLVQSFDKEQGDTSEYDEFGFETKNTSADGSGYTTDTATGEQTPFEAPAKTPAQAASERPKTNKERVGEQLGIPASEVTDEMVSRAISERRAGNDVTSETLSRKTPGQAASERPKTNKERVGEQLGIPASEVTDEMVSRAISERRAGNDVTSETISRKTPGQAANENQANKDTNRPDYAGPNAKLSEFNYGGEGDPNAQFYETQNEDGSSVSENDYFRSTTNADGSRTDFDKTLGDTTEYDKDGFWTKYTGEDGSGFTVDIATGKETAFTAEEAAAKKAAEAAAKTPGQAAAEGKVNKDTGGSSGPRYRAGVPGGQGRSRTKEQLSGAAQASMDNGTSYVREEGSMGSYRKPNGEIVNFDDLSAAARKSIINGKSKLTKVAPAASPAASQGAPSGPNQTSVGIPGAPGGGMSTPKPAGGGAMGSVGIPTPQQAAGMMGDMSPSQAQTIMTGGGGMGAPLTYTPPNLNQQTSAQGGPGVGAAGSPALEGQEQIINRILEGMAKVIEINATIGDFQINMMGTENAVGQLRNAVVNVALEQIEQQLPALIEEQQAKIKGQV